MISALTLAAMTTATEPRPRLELHVTPNIALGAMSSPVVYEPSTTARLPGDPGPILDGTSSPYRGAASLDFGGGFQFGSILAIGLDVGFRWFAANPPNDGTTELSRKAWTVGPYVRISAPNERGLRPYLSLGARYLSDTQRWSRPSALPDVREHWKVEHTGWALPFAIGVDALIGRHLQAGPFFGVTYAIPESGCAVVGSGPRFVESEYCASDDGPKRVIATHSYAIWTLGVAVRVLPFG